MPDNRRVLPRFYAPDLRVDAPFELPADEARHATRVLRLGPGDPIAVFDGRGAERRAEIVESGPARVSVLAREALVPPAPPPVPITLAQALLKGSSMDDVVRDATMMGAAVIQPLLTEHCTVKHAVVSRPETLERWRRVALASAKQSRRATLPSVRSPLAFDAWLQTAGDERRLIFVEPSAGITPLPLKTLLDEPVPAAATVLIGPEGGWAPLEVAAAVTAGCVPVSLGPLTIRAESMPVASLAALLALWQEGPSGG